MNDLEYILGIGSVKLEDCEQILKEMKLRKIELSQAKLTIEKEIRILDTIEFQTQHRKKELLNQAVSEREKPTYGLCTGCNASNVPIKLDKNRLPKCDNCLAIQSN